LRAAVELELFTKLPDGKQMVLNELQKLLGMEARLTGVFVSAHGRNLLNLLRQSSLEMQQRERVLRVPLIGQIANRHPKRCFKVRRNL
jgi:hypothetical protein